ncbi:uncharacterized protein [Cicer arietinum]|uniref:uncharacterized protein isoform X2 n=1 Tax=Cicer arietinum TaxID=3827 RepID=UPI003CC6C176
MEQKHVFLSALSVGVGLGVGLGRWVGVGGYPIPNSNEISEEQIVRELMNLVIDGKDSEITFDEFPYYLSDKIEILLTSAGFVHLRQFHLSMHAKKLSPISRAILLSGPAELYQQNLARALAHCFDSKLLLLDFTDFSLKMQNKYGCPGKEPDLKRSISEVTLEKVSSLFGSLSILPLMGAIRGTQLEQSSAIGNSINPPKLQKKAPTTPDMGPTSQSGPSHPAPLKCTNRFCFDEKLFLHSLYEVLVSISQSGSVILYIKDVDKIFLQSPRMYTLFQKLLKKLSGSVLILGSQIYDSENNCMEVDEKLTTLFPYYIEIKPPQDEALLKIWKDEVEEAMQETQLKDNRNHIAEVLASNDIDCNDWNSISDPDIMLLSNYIDEFAASAIFYHLVDFEHPEYRNGKLIISAMRLCQLVKLLQESESGERSEKDDKKDGAKKHIPIPKGTKKDSDIKDPEKEAEVPSYNEFEKRIRKEVIRANKIGVTFSDIGALDDVKETLQEVVMLPLRRPDIFKGSLLKPCRGVLLFGPPGTGKTMLAKAIANDAGASFINVSMSTLTSKLYGEDEKNVRALFSLAAKVAPTIIFIDEVDSMLGKRSESYEHEATRRIKNEFMSHWDGLLSKHDERILVLAATNRPFDLDEAIIRRFQRRIMVGLPSAESRERILKTVLANENHENIDFKELSTMTDGYSGSDLKPIAPLRS